jgi:dihydrofolate synthase/folylpolyglutamate synthase
MGSRWKLDASVVLQGLQNVTWPGRWQRGKVGERRTIFDVSHNTEGAEVLDLALSRLVTETGQAPIVVIAALGATRARPLLSIICRYAKEVHLIVPKQARACTHEELEALVPSTYSGPVLRGTVEAIFPGPDQCTLGTPSDVIVVTGSIYLLGEVLTRLEPERGLGEGRLQDF